MLKLNTRSIRSKITPTKLYRISGYDYYSHAIAGIDNIINILQLQPIVVKNNIHANVVVLSCIQTTLRQYNSTHLSKVERDIYEQRLQQIQKHFVNFDNCENYHNDHKLNKSALELHLTKLVNSNTCICKTGTICCCSKNKIVQTYNALCYSIVSTDTNKYSKHYYNNAVSVILYKMEQLKHDAD